jgi:hypothetical protein
MAASLNPFSYKPAQVAKAAVAVVTALVGIATLIASDLTTGGLSTAAGWVSGVVMLLTPVLVFLKRAENIIDAVDPSDVGTPGDGS